MLTMAGLASVFTHNHHLFHKKKSPAEDEHDASLTGDPG
jgi:hypothetical protein